jgi:hypothetical protein
MQLHQRPQHHQHQPHNTHDGNTNNNNIGIQLHKNNQCKSAIAKQNNTPKNYKAARTKNSITPPPLTCTTYNDSTITASAKDHGGTMTPHNTNPKVNTAMAITKNDAGTMTPHN